MELGYRAGSNQINDVVFVQVTAASLAAAGFTLTEIYELVSGEQRYLRISGAIL